MDEPTCMFGWEMQRKEDAMEQILRSMTAPTDAVVEEVSEIAEKETADNYWL